MEEEIISDFIEHKKILEKVLNDSQFSKKIIQIIELIDETLKNNQKIFIAGNGGSAADSQHFAAELVGRFERERKACNVSSLTTDTSIITSVSNDYGYEKIFSRQLEGLANENDVFIGISTSGNSENIFEAVKYCKQNGIKVVGLLGKDGGKIQEHSDISLVIPSENTARIQEMHEIIIHTICKNVEKNIK